MPFGGKPLVPTMRLIVAGHCDSHMTMITKVPFSVKDPLLSQPQFCEVAGIDMLTANNWVARRVLLPTEIGGRQIKGTRLYSVTKAFEGKLIGELVKAHKIPPSDAAKVAEKVVGAGWVGHWTRAFQSGGSHIPSFMLVAWVEGRLAYQQIAGDPATGRPDFSSVKASDVDCFLEHPFLVVPLSQLYLDVFNKCSKILSGAKAEENKVGEDG